MKVLAFDIETGAAEELHSYGPGFVRLCGWADVVPGSPVTLTTDPRELTAALFSADALTAHNGINFDLMAMAVEGFFSFDQYELLCKKMFDTMIVERHVNPVAAKGMQPRGYFGLDATAERYGLAGKSTVDFAGRLAIVRRVKGDAEANKLLKAYELRKRKAGDDFTGPEPVSALKVLADLYGGFDKIPQDDPDYRAYLIGDVQAQGRVFTHLAAAIGDESPESRRYVRREHYTATAMGRVTLEGMRTDVDETMKRWSEGQARLEAGKALLHEKFGMPTEGRYPHRTNPGKAAFRKAILSTGISEDALAANWPHAKDGSLKTGKDVLDEFIPIFERTKPAAAELCRTIKAFNGERTIYGTVLDHLVGERVHPYIGPDQASGRWSMKDPGLTVFGKRGGKARERGIMLADTDDEVLVAIDADQVDARVVAAECQDPEYLKLFAPGMDLHSEVAFRVWPSEADHGDACHRDPKPDCHCGVIAKCHCVKRDQAKVFGHGFSYGLGANGMARQHGVDVTVAKRFIDGMTEAFPRLAEWKAEVRAAAGALGFDEPVPANDSYRILHTWAGRPVRVERDRAYTQATALLGQGGTRDVMAEAILRLPAEYRRRIRAVIHDEIVISLPKHNAQQVAQDITDSMAFDLRGVAITFGCSDVARSWAGCYGAEYETAA
ncbi:DNA polymerase I [Streptomyces phage Maih]|uniref:DNA polymerase I n=3 Tax=Woodruffvirus TP1604 TaxID=1982746 RepID=A0A0U4IQT9_9CAUD|nr:DNA polymerase I [Streptomyces phage Maih]AWN08408.1 DNA polymerase I [Streptomyces phage BayC]AWN08478.1 DNA polymerase I [Streptomyces phage Salete]